MMSDMMDTAGIHIKPTVSPQPGLTDARLRNVCADFESIYINYIMKTARKALPQNGLFGNSHESKIYKSMMDEQMAQSVARGRGIGLGQVLYEQLKANVK